MIYPQMFKDPFVVQGPWRILPGKLSVVISFQVANLEGCQKLWRHLRQATQIRRQQPSSLRNSGNHKIYTYR